MDVGIGDDLKAEINVTPLVDVVLVLLVIFMVVTPLLRQEVPVELPLADHSRTVADPDRITLTVSADGRALLDGREMAGDLLVTELRRLHADRPDRALFLEADRGVPYGRVVEIMDDCREAGIVSIGVLTRQPSADEG